MADINAELTRLRRERDELLAALRQYLECTPCRNGCAPDDMTCATRRAERAIARAEGAEQPIPHHD